MWTAAEGVRLARMRANNARLHSEITASIIDSFSVEPFITVSQECCR